MFGEGLCSPAKTYEVWRIGRNDLIPTHTIEHHHNDATHETPFTIGWRQSSATAASNCHNLDQAEGSGQRVWRAQAFAAARLVIGG